MRRFIRNVADETVSHHALLLHRAGANVLDHVIAVYMRASYSPSP
jgi:hypothetical protein